MTKIGIFQMSAFKLGLMMAAIWLATSSVSHAAFYKWVDESGVTHFSESPPPAGHYEEMQLPSPAEEADTEQQSADAPAGIQDAAGGQPQTSSPNDDKEQAKVQAARELNCQLAKERLTVLENHDRIRYTETDGKVRLLSDEEKQAKLGEARKMMEEMCK